MALSRRLFERKQDERGKEIEDGELARVTALRRRTVARTGPTN